MADDVKAPATTAGSLKIDPVCAIKSGERIKAVFIIGAGGTGSHVVAQLARDVYSMEPKKRPRITICDGDVVEDKNLKRQHFAISDIGQNKAAALANRYSGAFGIEIAYKDSFVEKATDFQELLKSAEGPSIVITCVDNAKTRLIFREAIAAPFGQEVYWIDCGNEAEAGQVVLGVRSPQWRQSMIDSGRFPVPDVFDIYPELFEKAKADKTPGEMSCAELAASSPQHGHVNLNAAVVAVNWAHDLMHGVPVMTHVVEFSIKNQFLSRRLKESYVESWKTSKTFDKFAKFTHFEKKREEAAKKKASEPAATETKTEEKAVGLSVDDLNKALGR